MDHKSNLEHPCLAASHRLACVLGREAISSSKETVTAAKTRIFPLKKSLDLSSKYQTALLAQGLLTSQKDVTAALGYVQQGITALAVHSS